MSQKEMPSYKLIYFNGRGGAELSRLLFAAAGVEYEDFRIEWEEWPTHKPDMPLKAVPVLECDRKKYCQSAAIARYIARTHDLYGKVPLDGLKIDEVHEAVVEIVRESMQIHFEKDETKKAEKQKNFAKDILPKFVEFFENRLDENNSGKGSGKGFMVGTGLTLADLAVYNWLESAESFSGDLVFQKSPKLKAFFELVKAEPKIADWLKKRPVTKM